MKYIGPLIVGVLLVLWLAPAALGLIDAFAWMVTNHQLTPIKWSEDDRAGSAVAWTVFGLVVVWVGGSI